MLQPWRTCSLTCCLLLASALLLTTACSEELTYEEELQKLLPESTAGSGIDTVVVEIYDNNIFDFTVTLHIAPDTSNYDGIFYMPLFVSETPITFLRYPQFSLPRPERYSDPRPDSLSLQRFHGFSAMRFERSLLGFESEMISVTSKTGKYYYVLSITDIDTMYIPGEGGRSLIQKIPVEFRVTTQDDDAQQHTLKIPMGTLARATTFVISMDRDRFLRQPDIGAALSSLKLVELPEKLTPGKKTYMLQHDLQANALVTLDLSTGLVGVPTMKVLIEICALTLLTLLALFLLFEVFQKRRYLRYEYAIGKDKEHYEKILEGHLQAYQENYQEIDRVQRELRRSGVPEEKIDTILREQFGRVFEGANMLQQDIAKATNILKYINEPPKKRAAGVRDVRYIFWRIFFVVLIFFLFIMTLTAIGQASTKSQKKKRIPYPPVIEELTLELTPEFTKPGNLALKAHYEFYITSVNASSKTEKVTIGMRHAGMDDLLKFDDVKIKPKTDGTDINTKPVMKEFELQVVSGYRKNIKPAEMKFLISNKLPLSNFTSTSRSESQYTTLIIDVPYERYFYDDSAFTEKRWRGIVIHRFPFDYHKVVVPVSFRQATFMNKIVINKMPKQEITPLYEFTPHNLKETPYAFIYETADYLSLDKDKPLTIEIAIRRNWITRWMPMVAIVLCLSLNLFFAIKSRWRALMAKSLSAWAIMTGLYVLVVKVFTEVPSGLTFDGVVTYFDLVMLGCLAFTLLCVFLRTIIK